MKPQKQAVPVNFAGGLDTKTDPNQVGNADYLALNNSVFTTGGRLTKRNGFPSLGTSIVNAASYTSQAFGANVAAGRLVASYNNELLLNDGFNLFSYLADVDGWSYKGRSLLCNQSTSSIVKTVYGQINSDSAINTTLGQTLFAYEEANNGVLYSLVDTATGQIIVNRQALNNNTGSRPRCVAIGAFFYLIYFDSSDNKLHYVKFTSAGAGNPTAWITTINTTTPNFDVLVNNNTLYIAFNSTNTGSSVQCSSYTSSLSVVGSITFGSETAPNGIGCFADTSNNIWVAYNNGSATRCFITDSTTTSIVLSAHNVDTGSTALTCQNVTGIYDGTKGIIFYDQPKAPVVGPSFASTSTSFTQPNVGSSVNVTSSIALDSSRINETIVLVNLAASGVTTLVGYYQITAISTTTVTIKNLGYFGSAAGGASIAPAALGISMCLIGGYSNAQVNVNTLTVSGTAGTVSVFQGSAALNSRAFLYNSIAHVVMIHDDTLQPTYFLGSLYNYTPGGLYVANISAKIFDSTAGPMPNKSVLSSINTVSSGIFQTSLLQIDLLYTSKVGGEFAVNNDVATFTQAGVNSVQIDFTVSNPNAVVLGNNLIIGSGIVNAYDGSNVNEQNFNLYPSNITINPYATSGGLLTSGTYGYQVVYEWTDSQGQINQSSPSPVISVVYDSGSPQINYLTIPTIRLTEKAFVNIVVYRTQANQTIYYRLNQPNVPLLNDTTVTSVQYVDNATDASIIGNQQLYTTGGVQPNKSPPASVVMTTFKNRTMLVPSEDPTSFWYSEQVLTGVPVQFANAFVQNVGSAGGPITGLAQMDDKLIIFKETSILYMVGTGPSPTGAGNDFTDPLPVAVDCGCVGKNSIVLTPSGLIFKSDKGIYQLDRGLQASYIGAAVEAYNSYSVVSSKLIPNTTQVRFLLSNGTLLMYDYFYGKWATFSNPAGVSDCIFQGQHTYVSSAGIVYKESTGTYYDGTSTPILMNFTSSWIKLAGLQGYQRAFFFYLLGEYISAHSLTINVAYDYDSTSQQTSTIVPTNTATNTLERWRIFLAIQRCQAVQISVQEVYGGTPGAGFTFSGVNFIVGAKSGFFPSSSSNTVG